MWCWWPICYVGDMKFHLMPKSMKFFPSLNSSWGTQIGHQHHNTPECDVGDWYLMLMPNSRCWWRDLSPTSKSCPQHILSPTSVTNIDVTVRYRSLLTWLEWKIITFWHQSRKRNLPICTCLTNNCTCLWMHKCKGGTKSKRIFKN